MVVDGGLMVAVFMVWLWWWCGDDGDDGDGASGDRGDGDDDGMVVVFMALVVPLSVALVEVMVMVADITPQLNKSCPTTISSPHHHHHPHPLPSPPLHLNPPPP